MYEYSAVGVPSQGDPLGVVDGDTLHVEVDLGMDVKIKTTLRLYGINAPEMHGETKAAGTAAKAYALSWFAGHVGGGEFTVRTYKDAKEKYGRYLATVIAPDGAVLNDDLVASGNAVVYLP
jgi:endonuclease YncB( thermonuclease family)